ncbi:MAG: DHH family phosphoesterase [Piscirickettsiaceae bacterium]|nr:DHH family phosphoesterase [Piscirickettsiaceae bacterium]
MQYIDVFNGDADGICALIQLRRNEPRQSRLVTGIKRDINLLKQVEDGSDSQIIVLDISFEKNNDDVQRLLQQGAVIDYIDHHRIGDVISHANLTTDIDLSADMCTSLIVDKRLQGKYRAWAITAAFGDNLTDKAMQLGIESGFDQSQLTTLEALGTYINYNGYGANVDDLFFDPAQLYKKLVRYDSPFDFLQQDEDTFNTLALGYQQDMERAEQSPVIHQTDHSTVIQLPNEKWARRISGVFGNKLANRYPDKAHAILTNKTDGSYLVSVRAPLNRKFGADTLVSKFPTGGGRKAAAGINALPNSMLTTFIEAFEIQYSPS